MVQHDDRLGAADDPATSRRARSAARRVQPPELAEVGLGTLPGRGARAPRTSRPDGGLAECGATGFSVRRGATTVDDAADRVGLPATVGAPLPVLKAESPADSQEPRIVAHPPEGGTHPFPYQ